MKLTKADLKTYLGSQAEDRNVTYNDKSYGKFLDQVFDRSKEKQKVKAKSFELIETPDDAILPVGRK